METREYFEKVIQDYNQNRKDRSLSNYFRGECKLNCVKLQ